MDKRYIYRSIVFHIAILLLCVVDVSFFNKKPNIDEQPPIIVNLDDVVISDTTNIPEKAELGEERKVATRKERPNQEIAQKKTESKPKTEEVKKEEPKQEEILDIKSPALIEVPEEKNEIKEEPKKESDEPKKEKKKPAPIPQRKPEVKKEKKSEPKKKTPTKPKNIDDNKKTNKPIKTANPLASLMNSVDDLQKQIGEKDALAVIPKSEPVNNLGIEGGNSKGSYFSELSVSGIDFVKSKIQESWKTIVGGKDDRNIEVVISVKLTNEGLIESVKIKDMSRYRSDTYFQALADSAERAIYIAQDVHGVFKVLANQNGSSYNDWKEIHFTFTPLGLAR